MLIRATKRVFSYEDALATFPQIRDLTKAAVRQVEALWNSVHSREEMETRREELQETFDRIVAAWTEEVKLMGCDVKGLWLVDWDSGDGFYCWRYPEATVAHFHSYEEGFSDRLPIN